MTADDLAALARIATARSGGGDALPLMAAGMLRNARDGWLDLTAEGRAALHAAGHVWVRGIGWGRPQ